MSNQQLKIKMHDESLLNENNIIWIVLAKILTKFTEAHAEEHLINKILGKIFYLSWFFHNS